jgi:hypothetical protein
MPRLKDGRKEGGKACRKARRKKGTNVLKRLKEGNKRRTEGRDRRKEGRGEHKE